MTWTHHRKRALGYLVLVLLAPLMAHASPGVVTAESEPQPRVHIEADQMEVQQKTRAVRFTGNVRIRRGRLLLTCQALTGTYSAEGRIVRLEAEGPVAVEGPDFKATAGRAIYTQTEAQLTLHGNPTLTRGQSSLNGRKITIWLDEERVVIDGARGTLEPALLAPTAP